VRTTPGARSVIGTVARALKTASLGLLSRGQGKLIPVISRICCSISSIDKRCQTAPIFAPGLHIRLWYGVLLRIRQISGDAIEIPQGSLYPALYRLEHHDLGLYPQLAQP
jgi:hypothetical protein